MNGVVNEGVVMGNKMKFETRGHRPASSRSGGSLKVPRTSLDKLKMEVKRVRLKRQAEVRREATS